MNPEKLIPMARSAQNRCFGCGLANEAGLHLEFLLAEDGSVVCLTTISDSFEGPSGFLHGGIIATLLDCHSAAAVMWEADRRGWGALPGATIPYVTAGLDVRFVRPSPLTSDVELVAHVLDASESEIRCEVELSWEAKTRATATAVWKRWRPR